MDVRRCRVCQVSVASPEEWEQHCARSRHLARMQGNCDLCGISATSADLLEQHVLGRKHQKRLAAEPDLDAAEDAEFESRRCGMRPACFSNAHYLMHLQG